MDAQALRQIGLSRAKGVYLHDLAARLKDRRLDLERLRTLDDDAARNELTQVKGVGRFTADGVLMLALRRQDVWPAADLALRRAVERVWGLDAPASLAQVDALGERFRPWRTLAAAYLYRTSSKIGTTPARVSSWENRGVMPSGKYLARLPKALGVTADELLRAIDADGKRTRET